MSGVGQVNGVNLLIFSRLTSPAFMTVAWFAVSGILQGVEADNWDYDGTTKVNLIGGVGRAGRFEVHFVSITTNFIPIYYAFFIS